MPNANGQGTKTISSGGTKNTGETQKKKRHRRRNRNKNKGQQPPTDQTHNKNIHHDTVSCTNTAAVDKEIPTDSTNLVQSGKLEHQITDKIIKLETFKIEGNHIDKNDFGRDTEMSQTSNKTTSAKEQTQISEPRSAESTISSRGKAVSNKVSSTKMSLTKKSPNKNSSPSSATTAADTVLSSTTGRTNDQVKIEREQKSIDNHVKKIRAAGDATTPVKHRVASPSVNSVSSGGKLQTTTSKHMDIKDPTTKTVTVTQAPERSREQIMAEREAKKMAKQLRKVNGEKAALPVAATTNHASVTNGPLVPPPAAQATNDLHATKSLNAISPAVPGAAIEKTREQIKAEREAKKQAKQAAKVAKAGNVTALTQQMENLKISPTSTTQQPAVVAAPIPYSTYQTAAEAKKKPTLTKAERRAIQEAQRAAKAQKGSNPVKLVKKKLPTAVAVAAAAVNATAKATTMKVAVGATDAIPEKPILSTIKNGTSSSGKTVKFSGCSFKLFSHLEKKLKKDANRFVNNAQIHPSIARLGEQYAKRTVVGSNARCIAFLNALKMVIQDFETPPKKEFARSLEATIINSVEHLDKCRSLAVSVSNAYKHIKHVLTQLPTDKLESELKEILCHFIDTYVENQIEKAAQAICTSVQEKITDGDVLLTFGCSSLISYIFEEAQRRQVDFRVIVVDSRPFCEGQESLRRLTAKEIPCTYVLINAVGFVMPEVTKVLLGAHALLSNGCVMARTGTAQVALVARSYNVPVLVCCETHKFSERFQTDAIVHNELGDPDDLISSDKCCLVNWQAKCRMSPLNLMYDVTPPELVTAVVTEVAILPCTSVPVILRIKPTEIGYIS